MALPFSAGHTAVVLLGDGLDELEKELKGYCQHLKSAYDAAYGPAEACELRVVRFSKAAYDDFWSILPARREWIIFAVSHDAKAVADLVAGLGAGLQAKEGGTAAPHSGGRSMAVGIILTNSSPSPGSPIPPRSFFCETPSALAFCKILILHNHSARCICVDIDDLLTVSNSKLLAVEEHPPFGGGDAGYTNLLVKSHPGIWGIIKYERAWRELKAQDGWKTETFAQLYEFAAAQVTPDADVVIFDLWEPVV